MSENLDLIGRLETPDELRKAMRTPNTVVLFGLAGCAPCTMMRDDFQRNEAHLRDILGYLGVTIASFDVDSDDRFDIANEENVSGFPSASVHGEDGKRIGQIIGYTRTDWFCARLMEIYIPGLEFRGTL